MLYHHFSAMTTRSKRITILLGLGVVLALGAVFYIQYFLARPIGAGPAGPPVDRTAFERPWTDKHVRLLGIGDSVTAGLGARSPERSYFNRLVNNPAEEYADMHGVCLSRVLPNLSSENLAVSGSTSCAHANVVDELQPHATDVFGLVVLTTGGNDLIHNYGRTPPKECAMYGATLAQAEPWIAAFRSRLDSMLNTIEAAFPGGCEIYIADIYDPTDGVGDAPSVHLPHWPDGLAIHTRYNEIINECAAKRPNVHIVPLLATFMGHGSHCRQFWRETYVADDPHYWYFDNIEDPNDRGYDAIRRVVLNCIVNNSQLRRQQGPNSSATSESSTQ